MTAILNVYTKIYQWIVYVSEVFLCSGDVYRITGANQVMYDSQPVPEDLRRQMGSVSSLKKSTANGRGVNLLQ